MITSFSKEAASDKKSLFAGTFLLQRISDAEERAERMRLDGVKVFHPNTDEKSAFEKWILSRPVGSRFIVIGVYAVNMLVTRTRNGWTEQ